jgi:hypothetical protein
MVTIQFELNLDWDNDDDMDQAAENLLFLDGFPSSLTDDFEFEVIDTWPSGEFGEEEEEV